MKVKLKRSYKSKAGNTVFVYTVTGTKDELARYEEVQGDNHRVDEETGEVLWFTTRCIGQTGSLIITEKGKVIPDMSAYEQAASLSKQFGGNFGQELARAAVANLLGSNKTSDDVVADPIKKPLGSF